MCRELILNSLFLINAWLNNGLNRWVGWLGVTLWSYVLSYVAWFFKYRIPQVESIFFVWMHKWYKKCGVTMLYLYRSCVKQCKQTGCVKEVCLPQCNLSASNNPLGGQLHKPEPVYLRWKQWDCQSECRYHCMLNREKLRAEYDLPPVKYHGKWPFTRVYGIQVCLYVYACVYL